MTIFEVPATVTLVREIQKSGVLSQPVKPIATGTDEDRRETYAAMLDLIEQGRAGGPAYRALAARLMRLNGE
jgi:hypothetical protein